MDAQSNLEKSPFPRNFNTNLSSINQPNPQPQNPNFPQQGNDYPLQPVPPQNNAPQQQPLGNPNQQSTPPQQPMPIPGIQYPPQQGFQPGIQQIPPPSNSKWWMWLIVGFGFLIFLAIVGYLIFFN